jgi:hypothetical protein
VLPPELIERYAKLSFWSGLKGSKVFRIVPTKTETKAPAH